LSEEKFEEEDLWGGSVWWNWPVRKLERRTVQEIVSIQKHTGRAKLKSPTGAIVILENNETHPYVFTHSCSEDQSLKYDR